jgi:hypothetical protein
MAPAPNGCSETDPPRSHHQRACAPTSERSITAAALATPSPSHRRSYILITPPGALTGCRAQHCCRCPSHNVFVTEDEVASESHPPKKSLDAERSTAAASPADIMLTVTDAAADKQLCPMQRQQRSWRQQTKTCCNCALSEVPDALNSCTFRDASTVAGNR